MIRLLVASALALALSACDTFRDYRVGVEDPTRRDTVKEQPYYDYSKRETIYTR